MRASCWPGCRASATTRLPETWGCVPTLLGNGASALPPAASPDLAISPDRANRPSTVSSCVVESWRNWSWPGLQAWRAGTAARWHWRWAYRITRCGACCANKAFSFNVTAPGASTPKPPPRQRIDAASGQRSNLHPPQNALVLSMDEKPSIQALERALLRAHQQRQDRARYGSTHHRRRPST